jgi:hypothetical protein
MLNSNRSGPMTDSGVHGTATADPVHTVRSQARPRRFVFLSSNTTPWGGSEELWAGAAIALAEEGHRVWALKGYVDHRPPRVRRLRAPCAMKNSSRSVAR